MIRCSLKKYCFLFTSMLRNPKPNKTRIVRREKVVNHWFSPTGRREKKQKWQGECKVKLQQWDLSSSRGWENRGEVILISPQLVRLLKLFPCRPGCLARRPTVAVFLLKKGLLWSVSASGLCVILCNRISRQE